MSINLPAVIGAVSSAINAPPLATPLINDDPSQSKPVIICHTRDIDADVMTMLARYGPVESYDNDIHANVDPAGLPFAYLFVDLREKQDRLWFQKFIMGNNSYHLVLYRFCFENDLNISFESEFDEFPPKQATKPLYDKLLCSPPLKQPSACLSFLATAVRCAQP